ncbi:hypothetical protein BBAD15_g9601 [Beauveria bassiana D1-5]|uniref:Metallo-beta-lactamase domain-containing protein n=1 Tax=Beauveria bassiana D1-5 TaxID=1245745 RepID=A0A0A2VC92_BEABA|nr:hypothetical protein BBAD15_g9601 [Beauveria bassiana D1-5]
MTTFERTASPRAAPRVTLPASTSTVTVRAIDAEARMVGNAKLFVQPEIAGHEEINFTTMCFLIEHKTDAGTESILFDCGIRKDFWNAVPWALEHIGTLIADMDVGHGVDEILTEQGFNLSNLRTIRGHRIHEVDFPLEVGGFPAHDYFGDGSFYLLDVPGHTIGHICGFARTTPDTFIFMGADCSHYAGMLRPTEYVPMPDTIPPGTLDPYFPPVCPCSAFTVLHPKAGTSDHAKPLSEARSQPFYDVTRNPQGIYELADLAQESVDKVKALDAQDNVLICLAHDVALVDILPLYNNDASADINDWKDCGYKEKTRWGFLNDLPRDGERGRPPLVRGLWCGGKKVVRNEEGVLELSSESGHEK